MTAHKDDIEKEIAEIESDLEVLRSSITKYDEARAGAQTSAHIDGLLDSLKDIEKEMRELPQILRDVKKDGSSNEA